jgi:hypothetical protein
MTIKTIFLSSLGAEKEERKMMSSTPSAGEIDAESHQKSQVSLLQIGGADFNSLIAARLPRISNRRNFG